METGATPSGETWPNDGALLFMSRPARTFSSMNDCPECDHPVIYHNEHGCFAAPDCHCTEQSDRIT